jgi:hypothetical protein
MFIVQGVVVHQLMHVLSAFNEMQRPDRNSMCVVFVNIVTKHCIVFYTVKTTMLNFLPV